MSNHFIVTRGKKSARYYLEHIYPHNAEGIVVSKDLFYPLHPTAREMFRNARTDTQSRYILFGAELIDFIGCNHEQCLVLDSVVLNSIHVNSYLNNYGFDQPVEIAAIVKMFFEQRRLIAYTTGSSEGLSQNSDYNFDPNSLAAMLYLEEDF